jgi:hypothetical protein
MRAGRACGRLTACVCAADGARALVTAWVCGRGTYAAAATVVAPQLH